MTKDQLGQKLAQLIQTDITARNLSEWKIRKDPTLYPFTSSIVRQLERGEFSLKRIREIEEHLGMVVEFEIKEL